MVVDKRLDTLQEEIKLLKGELKHSLASVRDYLLNQELPTADLSNMGFDNGEHKISMKGSFDSVDSAAPAGLADDMMDLPGANLDETETPPEDEDLISVEPPAEEEAVVPEDSAVSEETTADAPEDEFLSEEEEIPAPDLEEETTSELPEEEPRGEEAPAGYARPADTGPTPPRVNMLANLITWVARAKKDIGYKQLPVFLEVYGLSGHLTLEMKEVILHLAEITAERPDAAGDAETWSQAMLTLHGILTGGDAPLHPTVPAWPAHGRTLPEEPAAKDPAAKEAAKENKTIEIDRPMSPLILKLVFPDGKQTKEFSIDLTPEKKDGGPVEVHKKQKSPRKR